MASTSSIIPPIAANGEKPKKFTGTDLKRWQQKMLFYLTTLNLARVLYEDDPMLKEGETDKQVQATMGAWNHSDFLYKNYILNSLDNTLYNAYSPTRTAKELWESLEKKYKTINSKWSDFDWLHQIKGQPCGSTY